MIEFTTFDVKTRQLLFLMRATTIETVDLQCQGDVDYVLGWHQPIHDFYVDFEGQVQPIAEAPFTTQAALPPPEED